MTFCGQSNQEHVCLQGEDRVLISCDDPASLGAAAGGHTMAGSKQWITVPVPHVYVGTNWPIRVGCRGGTGTQGVWSLAESVTRRQACEGGKSVC